MPYNGAVWLIITFSSVVIPINPIATSCDSASSVTDFNDALFLSLMHTTTQRPLSRGLFTC
jgi:hypothetical protein